MLGPGNSPDISVITTREGGGKVLSLVVILGCESSLEKVMGFLC